MLCLDPFMSIQDLLHVFLICLNVYPSIPIIFSIIPKCCSFPSNDSSLSLSIYYRLNSASQSNWVMPSLTFFKTPISVMHFLIIVAFWISVFPSLSSSCNVELQLSEFLPNMGSKRSLVQHIWKITIVIFKKLILHLSITTGSLPSSFCMLNFRFVFFYSTCDWCNINKTINSIISMKLNFTFNICSRTKLFIYVSSNQIAIIFRCHRQFCIVCSNVR